MAGRLSPGPSLPGEKRYQNYPGDQSDPGIDIHYYCFTIVMRAGSVITLELNISTI